MNNNKLNKNKNNILIFSIILITFSVANSQEIMNIKSYELSTPEKSWQALLKALKCGSASSVKSVTTPQGFENLSKYISPSSLDEPFESVFQSWGNMWSNLQLKWKQNDINHTQLKAGTHIFTFIKVDEKWKMDSWITGLDSKDPKQISNKD